MKKILLVDNDPFFLEFIRDLLEREGHEVEIAEDGLSALDVLDEFTPEFIFSDVVMPNIDGKRLCRILRRMDHLRNTKVIMVSSIVSESFEELKTCGADRCISKGPFEQMAHDILGFLGQHSALSLPAMGENASKTGRLKPRAVTRELLSQNRHLELLLDRLSEAIFEVMDGGRIVYANSAATRLTQISEEQLLGCPFYDIFFEKDRPRIETLFEQLGENSVRFSKEPLLKVNGHEVLLEVVPISRGSEKKLLILEDVSEQKAAERAREKMEDHLRRKQRMESVGRLAGGIAHDFNNLLMAIQGNTSLLLLHKDPADPAYGRLKNIEQYVRNGSDLTRQLLGFARGGKYETKITNLNDLIGRSCDMFARTRKEVRIHQKYQMGLWKTAVDRGQMDQVLMNLFINAWQAMPGGGDLTVETRNVLLEEKELIPYGLPAGKYVEINVSDTGTGMDEETRLHAFDPFFTTREPGRGTGLGLASCYGIVKNHQGMIDVQSAPGKGTTLTILLPAVEKPVRQEKQPSEAVPGGRETILLVEDEPMILDVAKDMLEAMGYHVLTADSGDAALTLYGSKSNDIDLVILDMVMPKMSGGETYDKLKKLNPHVKVLLSSGYSLGSQANAILDRGCNGFIQKPFQLSALSQKLREFLDEN
jgi:two-component system cell cycle sensor histidine kinase/response regulator CckA